MESGISQGNGSMQLISENYRQLNRELHEAHRTFGVFGRSCAGITGQLAQEFNTRDILDYGCGKRKLEKALGYEIFNYDPAIPGCDDLPTPHDIVVCSDVLEHVEPEHLGSVLRHLRHLIIKAAFITIATVPSNRILADGRNAHLIVRDQAWWLPLLLEAGFYIRQLTTDRERIYLVCL